MLTEGNAQRRSAVLIFNQSGLQLVHRIADHARMAQSQCASQMHTEGHRPKAICCRQVKSRGIVLSTFEMRLSWNSRTFSAQLGCRARGSSRTYLAQYGLGAVRLTLHGSERVPQTWC